MKKIISMILILVMTVSMCSCSKETGPVVAQSSAVSEVVNKVKSEFFDLVKTELKENKTADPEITSCFGNFALRSLKTALTAETKGKNVMISPASLMFALDMAASGAEGNTYSQIVGLIKKDVSKIDMLKFANYYMNALKSEDVMSIANSVWINENSLKQDNIKINEEFLGVLREYLDAAAETRPFNDAAKDEINSWISNKTDGMINNAIDRFSDDTVMLLINALAFNGKWKDEYKSGQINENGNFKNYAGESETAKMLSSEEKKYFETESEKGFLKYYEGEKYAFMAILPNNAKISINDYVSSLSDDAITKFYKSLTDVEVDTIIPAFSFDYDIEMNDMLKAMGMTEAFSMSADFSTMLDPETSGYENGLHIGKVIQKTHIDLDENGTKAAASTIVVMEKNAISIGPDAKKKVVLNRPFALAIMDTETGTPVFAGIVNTVK